jgi:hypothetical protein
MPLAEHPEKRQSESGLMARCWRSRGGRSSPRPPGFSTRCVGSHIGEFAVSGAQFANASYPDIEVPLQQEVKRHGGERGAAVLRSVQHHRRGR